LRFRVACHVIRRTVNPGVLRRMTPYDVASNIRQALPLPPEERPSRGGPSGRSDPRLSRGDCSEICSTRSEPTAATRPMFRV